MAINTLFQNIANAIRSVNSSTDTYTPEEMPEAIMNLSTGDMLKSEYDPNETVLNAGGIEAYTADAISGKADSATTLAGYGIADAYTITQVDTLLSGKAGIATTLAGYGIADAYTITQTDTLLSAKANSATTLSGYGITDAYTKTETDTLLGAKAGIATTLAGYGITDAYTKTETDTLLTAKANASDLSSLSDTVDTNTNNISTLNSSLTYCLDAGLTYHNIPRNVPKDITSYVSDGSLWHRLNGTSGYSLYEDIYVGDYIQMSRSISAYEQSQTYQTTGSQYVTIAGIDWYMQNGDAALTSHHLVMVPGQGFGGTQHFGRSRMNSANDTTGGYVASEMFTTTLGAVATSGSTISTATINEQLYAEFGSHLLTTRELLSNTMDSTRYNRFGQASGATSGWAWTSCQAVLMSEIELYGSIVFSSAGQDTGTACRQLPLFAHSKLAQNNRTAWYWLKDVASAAYFCGCRDNGGADYNGASYANACVRPRFILA